jgi:hypothetical protein
MDRSQEKHLTRFVRLEFLRRLHVTDAGRKGVVHHGVHRLAVIVTAWSYKLELDEPTIILGGHMS